MSIVIDLDQEVAMSEIDEALSHAWDTLKIDIPGNRMNWKKAELLRTSIDDLLDMRIDKMREASAIVSV